MKKKIRTEANIIEFLPLLTESEPRDGPIVFSCKIDTGIGRDPDFNIIAKSSDGEIEGIKHSSLPWEGWMWHPERDKEINKINFNHKGYQFI